MKTYKPTDHAKLNSEFLREQFVKYMFCEWGGYIEITDINSTPTGVAISAHNDGDFDWFVAEFMKDLKKREAKAMRMWNKELQA